MSASPAPPDGAVESKASPAAADSKPGRWKIGAALLAVACVAQAILWAKWWEDPTHFKMSILFVWPAALFSLLIWWTFFSGWSAKVRYRSVGIGFAALVAFLSIFRFERFDGDMVPKRIVPFWVPTSDQQLKQFLEQARVIPAEAQSATPAAVPLVANESDWPGYRGAARDGIVRGVTLRDDWSAKPPREIWRHPVGRAWSSFAVVGDMAFTQEQRESNEAVVAYSLSSGQQLWAHLDEVKFIAAEGQGGIGPRATPQFQDGKLYTLGATGLLNCLDARDGKKIWSADILKDAGEGNQPAANLVWGLAASPLVVDQLVIVNPGGPKGQSVAAYDKDSGQRIWSGGDHPASYGCSCVGTILGERQILVPQGTGLAGHSLADGRELWFFPWQNASLANCALPVVVADNSLLFGTGYGVGTVRLDLSHEGPKSAVTQRWHSNRFRPKFNDFVLHEGHVYGLDDGTLTCLDIESGKVKWKSGRYGYGQLLLVSETLLILSETGRVVLVPAKPSRPDETASFQALNAEDITWNHPVLVRGKLLVRNAHEAACFELD